jgi:DNA-binding response OmpR family regulator
VNERDPLVLICDDEPALRELMRVSLGDAYRFREAGGVDEALAELRTERPHAVLLDLMLPGGSGLDVLEAMRSDPELKAVPVLVVSAWSDEANRAAVKRGGGSAFVAKPFHPEELKALVRKFISEREKDKE